MKVPDDVIKKARDYPIYQLWNDLGVQPGPVRNGQKVRSPFRNDRNPGCQIGGQQNIFKDFATGEVLDPIEFVRKVKNLDFMAAIKFLTGWEPLQNSRNHNSPPNPPSPIKALAKRWERPVEAITCLGAKESNEGDVMFPMRSAAGEITGWRLRRGDGSLYKMKGHDSKAISRRPEGQNEGRPCTSLIYRYPFPEEGDIWVTEGEHDLVAITIEVPAAIGIPGSPPSRYCLEQIKEITEDRRVYIVPDNDAAGEKLVNDTLGQIKRTAARVYRVKVPAEHKDLSDYLNTEYSIELALDELRERAELIGGNEQPIEWPDIIPLGGGADDLPALDPDLLGQIPGNFARALAESTGTSTDMATGLVLGVMAAAVSRRFIVKVHETWHQYTNLWVSIISPPGTGKSPCFAGATHAVEEWMKNEKRRLKEDIEKSHKKLARWEKRMKHLESKLAKASGDEAEELEEEIEEHEKRKPSIVKVPMLLFTSATPESLARAIVDGEGVTCWATPERGYIEDMVGRYQEVDNAGICLKAWNGEPDRRVLVTRESPHLENPLLNVVGMQQPSALNSIGERRGIEGAGMLDRYLWVMTDCPHTPVDKPIAYDARREWQDAVWNILSFHAPEEEDAGRWHVLGLSPGARKVWMDYRYRLADDCKPGGVMNDFEGLAQKFPSQVLRIAGCIHVFRHAGGDPRMEPVSEDAMTRAIKLMDIIRHHSIAAIERAVTRDLAFKALKTWEKIKRLGSTRFASRDIQRLTKSFLTKGDDVQEVLEYLAERGYVAGPLPARKNEAGRGRPKGPFWEVRPGIMDNDPTVESAFDQ